MLRKIGSSLKHQPSTQYPCTSPQSLHEMNRRFGELKLALGVKKRTPSYCARSYTEVLPAGCWNDASRASIQKGEGPKSRDRGL